MRWTNRQLGEGVDHHQNSRADQLKPRGFDSAQPPLTTHNGEVCQNSVFVLLSIPSSTTLLVRSVHITHKTQPRGTIHVAIDMSDSPMVPAGPSSHVPRADPPLLPAAVMEYLQQHGFDKALQALQVELSEKGGEEKDADGEEEGAGGAATGAPARRGSAVGREAIFRAPQPIALDNMVKRNIPQATTVSASTMSDKITPDFIAQAKYIIEQLQTRLESTNGEEEVGKPGQTPTAFIDPSDRVEGYRRYRQWVSGGLDMWKFELDNVSFPLFAHTFLDLIDFGFTEAGKCQPSPCFLCSHPFSTAILSGKCRSTQAVPSLRAVLPLVHYRVAPDSSGPILPAVEVSSNLIGAGLTHAGLRSMTSRCPETHSHCSSSG